MIRAARFAYAAVALAFVVAILLQVYFIGLGLFSSADFRQLHADFGWILHLVPPFIVLAAGLAAAGRARILQAVALAVVIFFTPILAAVRADAPLTAAFHPVAAVLGFLLAIVVSRGAVTLLRSDDAESRTTLADWILVAVVAALYLFVSLSGSPEPAG
jgi:hypothetical protein